VPDIQPRDPVLSTTTPCASSKKYSDAAGNSSEVTLVLTKITCPGSSQQEPESLNHRSLPSPTMPVVTLPQFGATRLRSYILRLPLFTRCIIGIMVLLWIVSIQKVWDVQKWGALYPDEIGLSSSKQPISNSYILGF
jgi:hypothetical protein